MKKCLCLMMMILIPLSVVAGDVYKWTDAQGRVHYGDHPAQKDAKKVQIKPGSGDGGTEAARKTNAIESLKMQDKKYADCKNRKEQLANWKVASKIVEKDGLGKERSYSAAEKEELLKRTQSSIDKDCSGL